MRAEAGCRPAGRVRAEMRQGAGQAEASEGRVRAGSRQGAPGAGRAEASGSWRGGTAPAGRRLRRRGGDCQCAGDCAGGVAIAPIAPAGRRLRRRGSVRTGGAVTAPAGQRKAVARRAVGSRGGEVGG